MSIYTVPIPIKYKSIRKQNHCVPCLPTLIGRYNRHISSHRNANSMKQ